MARARRKAINIREELWTSVKDIADTHRRKVVAQVELFLEEALAQIDPSLTQRTGLALVKRLVSLLQMTDLIELVAYTGELLRERLQQQSQSHQGQHPFLNKDILVGWLQAHWADLNKTDEQETINNLAALLVSNAADQVEINKAKDEFINKLIASEVTARDVSLLGEALDLDWELVDQLWLNVQKLQSKNPSPDSLNPKNK